MADRDRPAAYDLPEGQVLVRLAAEIVERLQQEAIRPAVLLGVRRLHDGTHELYLREPDLESAALKALVALLADGSVRAAMTPEHLDLARAAGWEERDAG